MVSILPLILSLLLLLPNVSRYKVQLYPNQVNFIPAQPKKLSSSNCQVWQRGREKYKNKGDEKEGKEAYFCYLKEKYFYIS